MTGDGTWIYHYQPETKQSYMQSKRRVVRWRNFAHRRVQTMCKTSTGFMSKRVVVTKKLHFKKNYSDS